VDEILSKLLPTGASVFRQDLCMLLVVAFLWAVKEDTGAHASAKMWWWQQQSRSDIVLLFLLVSVEGLSGNLLYRTHRMRPQAFTGRGVL
jgi:hypothetical protein